MKIVVADNVSQSAVEVLRSQDSWQVVNLPAKPAGAGPITEEIKDADALIVRSATKVNQDLLARASKLRVVGRAGVGVDNVDLPAATARGVVVMNTPGGNAVSVAEHTFGLMLALARRLPQADSSMKKGVWEKKKLTGSELRGKALGLVGLGRVGAEVARLAQAFGMTVLAYDPYVSASWAEEQRVKLIPLEELLRSSDFVSLHASLTPATRHLINSRTLATVKPGARIINCARGELLNEADLLVALIDGRVAGAGLDVFESEPPKDQSLTGHPNVVASPHIAGSTEEAQELVGIRIAEQVRDYLLTGVARNAVNMPTLSTEEQKKLEPYLQLGEKLGEFLAQIAGEGIESVQISYDGGLAELNTHLVKNAVLKGILDRIVSGEVNLINAGALAKSRGIEVTERWSTRRVDFSNSLGISVRAAGEACCSVLGMVGLRGDLRLLGVDNIDIEAPLRGTILFIRNRDVPGVIGRVGTLLGDRQVNIASFALGRRPEMQGAIGLVNVDSELAPEVVSEIRSIPAVLLACVIQL
jgi:D-3-phosphoglycerate dehydrogenase